ELWALELRSWKEGSRANLLLFSQEPVAEESGDPSMASLTRRSTSLIGNVASTSARTSGFTAATIVPQYLSSEQTATSRALADALVPTPTTRLPNSRSRWTSGE